MRIDVQIATHFRQQIVADFFLPIFQGRKFPAEVQTPVATFTFIAHIFAGNLPCLANLRTRRSNSAPYTTSSIGHLCPNVNGKVLNLGKDV